MVGRVLSNKEIDIRQTLVDVLARVLPTLFFIISANLFPAIFIIFIYYFIKNVKSFQQIQSILSDNDISAIGEKGATNGSD